MAKASVLTNPVAISFSIAPETSNNPTDVWVSQPNLDDKTTNITVDIIDEKLADSKEYDDFKEQLVAKYRALGFVKSDNSTRRSIKFWRKSVSKTFASLQALLDSI